MSETEDVSATDRVQWRCLELLGNNLAASLQNIDLPAASRFVCVVTQGRQDQKDSGLAGCDSTISLLYFLGLLL